MSKCTDTVSYDNNYVLKLFNLEAADVEDIHVSNKNCTIIVDVTLSRKIHACPLCTVETDKVKDYRVKKIRHSIITNTPLMLHYRARRYICPVCGKTFYEHNPFAIEGMKISAATVFNCLRDLKSFNETFTSVGNRYYLSGTTVASLFDAHVDIPRTKLSEYICIDEVYAFKSKNSQYVCVILDYKTQNIIDLLPSRRKHDLINYFSYIPREERLQVKVVSGDMWLTYQSVTKTMFPNAVYAVDRFHVIQELTRQTDKIRIRVMNRFKTYKTVNKKELKGKELVEYEHKDRQYYILKKFNWLLFKNDIKLFDPNHEKKYNRKLNRYLNYDDILTLMLNIDIELKEAYELKDSVVEYYRTANKETAKDRLNELISELNASNIKEMNHFAKTLIKWRKGIINSFIVVNENTGMKINNGIIENRNKTIKNIKHNSNGFTNWNRFRNRVMYVLNKDTTFRYLPKTEARKKGEQ